MNFMNIGALQASVSNQVTVSTTVVIHS